jgi:hypothetical protein
LETFDLFNKVGADGIRKPVDFIYNMILFEDAVKV